VHRRVLLDLELMKIRLVSSSGLLFFVNRFRDEEGGSKQVWDGCKGMFSSFAVPNCFGSSNVLPSSLKPALQAGPPLSAISVLRDWQFAEKVIFRRLLKNAQMQGPRNPEE